jgi:hypothetical protein
MSYRGVFMAISTSFNGATIYRPGSYSKTQVDLGGNIPLGRTGLVAIFGEADSGTPGANEVNISNNFYTADRLVEARAKYRSGPIMEALSFLFAPAADGAIPSGAQTVWVYKTNASTRAEKALTGTGWSDSKVRAIEWGTGGNRATIKIEGSGSTRTITISQKRDLIVETATVGGNTVITLDADDALTITATTVSLSVNGGTPTVLPKSDFKTVKQLVEALNLLSPTAPVAITSSTYNQLSPNVLDHVTAASSVKKDAHEVREVFAESQIADLVVTSGATSGLPNAIAETALTGGEKGATTSSDITTALTKFEKIHVNSVVPLFSRDADDDISDSLTDEDSDYEIDAIHQAVKTHISLMKTTKQRSERQGYLSLKSSYATSKEKAGDLADARIQLVIQDVRQIDAAGTIKWFQPWALACLLAGARGGASVGLPMTFKFLNCSGARHTDQAMTTPEEDITLDFDPDTQYEDAIQSGITFLEAPKTGGFRIVVDNTTYGIDDNWVYNRGNVLYAADIVAYNFRNTMETRYVGVKNTLSANEVKSTAASVLATFLSQGITVSSADAAQGFKDLTVTIQGNTINITVTVKLVEGVDFVLNDITLQRASQTA